MTVDDQIRDEKLQYGTNRKAAKISVLSSGKINKYKYQISYRQRNAVIFWSKKKKKKEQAKFT